MKDKKIERKVKDGNSSGAAEGGIVNDLNEQITEVFLDDICKILRVKPEDTVTQNGWHKQLTRDWLSSQIKVAYMHNKPDKDVKKMAPSKQAEKALEHINAIKTFKKRIIPLCPNKSGWSYGEMAKSKYSLLHKLQNTSNAMSKNPTKDRYIAIAADSGKDYLQYDFDKQVNNLIETLEWLENCFNKTHKQLRDEVRVGLPTQPNKGKDEFFLTLCNIYHEITGDKPESKYTNEYGTGSVDGKTIDFLELCFNAFDIKLSEKNQKRSKQSLDEQCSRRALHDKLQKTIKHPPEEWLWLPPQK